MAIIPTREDWIYLAGILDGEGSIGVYTRHNMDKSSRVLVQVGNTDARLIMWLKSTFGGNVAYCDMVKKYPKRQPMWYWKTGAKSAQVVLENVIEHLKLKKEQAALALESRLLVGSVGRRVSDEVYEQQTQIKNKIYMLNAVGRNK